MGKKKQQNDFFFFMVEKKGEMERRLGRIVTMAELPNLVYPEWKAMPEEEKQKYKNMRDNRRGQTAKMDCRGIPLEEIQQEQEKKKKKIEEMKSYLVNNISVLQSGNSLHCGTFYVVSTSYYVVTEEGYYVPAEVGVVKFSFQKGIIKEFHVIMKPVIPMSYGYSAQNYSEANHKLLEEENDGADNKEEVAEIIMAFVEEESNRLPPVYTLEEEMLQTELILGDICGPDYFTVYSLDQLFQNLYSVTFSDNPIPLSIATDMITNCSLDFHPSLPCQWHQTYQKDAGRYCTLACARRWVYHMCDNMNLLKTFGIQPQEGKHKPLPMPTFGVVVDVPRHTLQDVPVSASSSRYNMNSFSTSSWEKVNSSSSISRDPQNRARNQAPPAEASFSFTRKAKPEQAPFTSKASQRPSGAWANVVATSSLKATSSSSLSTSSVNTSHEEDFPALGARSGYSGHKWNPPAFKKGQKKM